MALIEKKLLPLRPGVAKQIDQALSKGVKVAVCTTSNEKAVSAIVSCLLGPERAEKMQIFAGDVVPQKKPDPVIYILASTTLGVEPANNSNGSVVATQMGDDNAPKDQVMKYSNVFELLY